MRLKNNYVWHVVLAAVALAITVACGNGTGGSDASTNDSSSAPDTMTGG